MSATSDAIVTPQLLPWDACSRHSLGKLAELRWSPRCFYEMTRRCQRTKIVIADLAKMASGLTNCAFHLDVLIQVLPQ